MFSRIRPFRRNISIKRKSHRRTPMKKRSCSSEESFYYYLYCSLVNVIIRFMLSVFLRTPTKKLSYSSEESFYYYYLCCSLVNVIIRFMLSVSLSVKMLLLSGAGSKKPIRSHFDQRRTQMKKLSRSSEESYYYLYSRCCLMWSLWDREILITLTEC